MLFSILIANYNNSSYLETALKSVISQTYSQWEVILVDDGSTDDFDNIITSFSTEKRIRVFRNGQNHGCGFTKKKCISLASGSILGFLDPDDALAPDAIAIMVEAHMERPGHSIVHSTHYICNDKLMPSRVAEYPRSLPDGVPYLLLNDGRIHHFASFKKSAYSQTPGLSELNKKAVDQDLYYLLEEAGDVEFIDKPLYFYRIHSQSISTSGKEWETTLWHYAIIQDACMRRISRIRLSNDADKRMVIKYRVRYNKIGILRSFRRKQWLLFARYSISFIFSGGLSNIISYIRKIPEQGFPMIKRTFYYDHQIKA